MLVNALKLRLQLVRFHEMSQVRKAKTDCVTSTDFTVYIIDWAVCVRSDILIWGWACHTKRFKDYDDRNRKYFLQYSKFVSGCKNRIMCTLICHWTVYKTIVSGSVLCSHYAEGVDERCGKAPRGSSGALLSLAFRLTQMTALLSN